MLKQSLLAIAIFSCASLSFAGNTAPTIDFYSNIHLQQLNTAKVDAIKLSAIEIVKSTLKINANSPYRAIKINPIFNADHSLSALVVYMLSNQYKSFETVRINLSKQLTVTSVDNQYHVTDADRAQLTAYATKSAPSCPDTSVEFVVGNSFTGDSSVENEVQTVYQLAKDKGYNPILLDVNNTSGPQPTIQAYENWMSCPKVRGFYNESHGSNEEILLSDGDFTYKIINDNLQKDLKNDVVLFDSCETFNKPLLTTMLKPKLADSQQYIAGIVALPFGSSERTASCIWTAALNGGELTQDLVNDCSKKNSLKINSFKIKGNGDDHIGNIN